MASTYIWRPTGGQYFNAGGSYSAANSHAYYASNRAFRLDFPNFTTQLGLEKSKISISRAVLHVYIETAYSATLTIGYNYDTTFGNRQSLLASAPGISMNTTAGWMEIDLTDVIRAYMRDAYSSATVNLWAYGTGGSTSLSYISGYSASTTSQRPYIEVEYGLGKVRIFTGGVWKTATPYVRTGNLWKQADVLIRSNQNWK